MSDAPAPTVIAEFNSWESLRAALRKRWNDRGYAIEDANERIGLPARFLNRILAPNSAATGQTKYISWDTLPPILLGFGLKCILVEDPEAVERYESLIKRRNPNLVRQSETYFVMTDKRWAKISRLGRERRWKGKTKKERSAAARHAITERWRQAKLRQSLPGKRRRRRSK